MKTDHLRNWIVSMRWSLRRYARFFVSKPALVYLIFSFVVLLVLFPASPLIRYNPLPSPNMFIVIGTGIFDGLVPYRDLFDGKGIVAFFLPGLFTRLIPWGGYTGSWLLSVLCLTILCYYLHRWACLLNKDASVAYLAVAMCVGLALMGNGSYCYGGTSDEYAAPLMAALGYYSYLLWLNKGLSIRQWIISGLCIGLIFWNKFTLAAPACVLMGLPLLLDRGMRQAGTIVRAFGSCLLGFFLVTAPIIAYFAWNNALDDLYYGYYEFHVRYHEPGNLLFNLAYAAAMHPLSFLVLFLSCVMMAMQKSCYKYIYLCSCMVLLACIYISSSFQYYFLPVLPFCLYGLVRLQDQRGKITLLCRIACIAVLLISSSTIRIGEFERYSRAELISRRSELEAIAAYCQQYEDKTLLHAGGFDSGFYTISGTKPSVTYYQRVNYNPIGDAEQARYIKEHKCAFALTRSSASPDMIALLHECGYVACELPEPAEERCFSLFHYKGAK